MKEYVKPPSYNVSRSPAAAQIHFGANIIMVHHHHFSTSSDSEIQKREMCGWKWTSSSSCESMSVVLSDLWPIPERIEVQRINPLSVYASTGCRATAAINREPEKCLAKKLNPVSALSQNRFLFLVFHPLLYTALKR